MTWHGDPHCVQQIPHGGDRRATFDLIFRPAPCYISEPKFPTQTRSYDLPMATDSPQAETQETTATKPVHRLYIDTVGCQMNVLDSEMVVADLRRQGYELASSVADADTILFNTCSVREQAENKTYSALGRLKDEKKKHPDKIIGVMGCMAQKDQKLIFKKAPFVDIVVGPGQLKEIPGLIEKARSEGGQHTAVGLGRKDGKLDIIKR